jgi:foldase protein PrsA
MRTMLRLAAAGLLCGALFTTGCGSRPAVGSQQDNQTGSAVATVNGEKISQAELDTELNKKFGPEALSTLIDDKLIMQEAKKQKIDVTDKEVTTRFDEVKAAPQYNELMKSKRFTDTDLQAYIKRLIYLQKLILQEIPEQEKLKMYDQFKDQLEQAHIYHILLEPSQKTDAEKIYKDIKSGKEPFADAAKQFSKDDNSKEKGGELGWLPKSAPLDPPFAKVAFSCPLNEPQAPVKTKFGWHIIMVTGRKKTYDDLKSDIEDRLVSARQGEYLQRLRVKADIKSKFDTGTAKKDGGAPATAASPDAKTTTAP